MRQQDKPSSGHWTERDKQAGGCHVPPPQDPCGFPGRAVSCYPPGFLWAQGQSWVAEGPVGTGLATSGMGVPWLPCSSSTGQPVSHHSNFYLSCLN